MRDYRADILIAGGRNMYTALKAKVPFLDINQERDFGYAGYEGMKELVRQLALTLESPVWEAVRTPAPWTTKAMVVAGPELGDSPDAADDDGHDHDHHAPAGAAA